MVSILNFKFCKEANTVKLVEISASLLDIFTLMGNTAVNKMTQGFKVL